MRIYFKVQTENINEAKKIRNIFSHPETYISHKYFNKDKTQTSVGVIKHSKNNSHTKPYFTEF